MGRPLGGPRDLIDRLTASQRLPRHVRFQRRTQHVPLHRLSPLRHAILSVQSTTLFGSAPIGRMVVS